MRLVATAFVLCGLAAAAHADPYRWCADGVNGCGSTSCTFVTLEQCRAATAGNNSSHCTPNPYYTGPGEAAPRLSKKKH